MMISRFGKLSTELVGGAKYLMRPFLSIIDHASGASVLPLTDADILSAKLPSNVRRKLFKNREAAVGTRVAVRLNLNTKITKGGRKFSIQTIHARGRPDGAAIGYDSAVTLRDCTFFVNQNARADIAMKLASKSPMAAVVGDLTQKKPVLSGTVVRFNPRDTHLFVRADDNRAVRSAEEVTVFGDRCFARGALTYWSSKDAPKAKHDVPSQARFGDAN